MKKISTLLLCLFIISESSYTQNTCNSAIALTITSSCDALIIDNTNLTASGETPEPSCGSFGIGIDAWFTVVVPASGGFIIQTTGDGTLGDMVMQSYQGSCGNLTLLECDDDGGVVTQSQLQFSGLTVGSTIFLRVNEYGSDFTGTFGICAFNPIYETGDLCNSALPLTVESNCNVQNIDGSFADPNYASIFGCIGSSTPDIWFELDVPASGSVNIETKDVPGGMTDMVIQTFTNGCFIPITLKCDDDSGDGSHSLVILNDRPAGEKIHVQVAHRFGNTGSFGICAYEPVYLPGDLCSSATSLTVGESCNFQTFTTEGFKQSGIIPDFTCGASNPIDRWFTAIAPASGRIAIETAPVTGGIADLVVQTYRGDCFDLDTYTCKNNNVDGNTHPTVQLGGLNAGETVYIRIASVSSDIGEFQICVYDIEAPLGDLCEDAIHISPLASCIPQYFSNEGKSNSNQGLPFNCGAEGAGLETWFSTTIPPSGNVTIETTPAPEDPIGDLVLQVYIGDCDALTYYACNDDGGTGAHSLIEVIDQNPGDRILFEVVEYGSNSFGFFGICAYDPSAVDNDDDGWSFPDDCDDDNPDVNPGQEEIIDNEIDDNCDGINLSATHELTSGAINIYPNPTSGLLHFEWSNIAHLNYTITDLSGKQLLQGRLNNTLDLSNFANGIYVIIIEDDLHQDRIFEKIVLNK